MNSKKEVMRSRCEKLQENLGTIQKGIQDAAGKVAHGTKNEREKIADQTPENVRKREEGRCKVHKSAQETSEESQSGTSG